MFCGLNVKPAFGLTYTVGCTGTQASQQLAFEPQQAVPPLGATQWAQSGLAEQLVLPLALVL